MLRTVQALFDGEVLCPQEPLDLEANVRYRVTIEDEPSDGHSPSESGVFDDLLALAEELDLPSDLSARVDRYPYGAPRR